MTILVFNLHIPLGIEQFSLATFLKTDILHKLFIYIGSFIILGTLWVSTNFQYGFLQRVNRIYLWFNICYLMMVCIIPFSANLMIAYPHSPISVSFYAVNLLLATLGYCLNWECAYRYQLNTSNYSPAIRRLVLMRILIAPLFYFSALIIAYWDREIAFIVLVAPICVQMIPGRVDRYVKNNDEQD